MNLQFQFDRDTAIKIADLLAGDGQFKAAGDMWFRIGSLNPYDLEPRRRSGNLFCQDVATKQNLSTLERAQLLLRIIAITLPTPALVDAYFDTLKQVLAGRSPRETPGRIILGIGPGRCGSTTLTSVFSAVPESCSTHENPPPLFWQPTPEQIKMHLRRFRVLRDYFDVIFDAAHWWIHLLDPLFTEFPETKVVGLVRDADACVASFMRLKGSGRGTLNHWATPGNGIWGTSPGDPLYPSYAVPSVSVNDPDAGKAALIARYVNEYNDRMQALAAAHPDRITLVRTEELSNAETYARLSDFLGVPLSPPNKSLNVGGAADSDQRSMAF